ncbi:hypothetical protein [Acrocarpospora pleiomorpha]|uniref:hypothetical protein n=1 Tax=Acrocarpospora pleiomorpha TaxID=90975 RepID=UPI0012D327C1|nr:hypothetical protein [Acrocarpospora pleiomorpha]
MPVAILGGMFTGGLAYNLVTGISVGIAVGLVVGVAFGLVSRPWSLQEPGFANLRLRDRGSLLARRLAAGFAFGLPFGLVFMLVFGLATKIREKSFEPTFQLTSIPPDELSAMLQFGLAFGLAFSLALGFMQWAEAPAEAQQAPAPMSSWRADRAANLARTAVFMLAFVLMVVGVFSIPFVFHLQVGLALVLAAGFTAGFTVGDHHAWLAYLVATYRLAWVGRLPRALMLFLDDAHRLGLLRAVGPLYQFRHADLHDHLAADPPA